ncbi:MAG: hypothetical protein HY551_07165 [Elusimicrobia bacterium]|nr:hypothetical protein [Elusimicrobiota bacterium]
MIELILMLNLAGLQMDPTLAQLKPCVWPNRCAQPASMTAQIKTCVWPNRCAQPAPVVAQIKTCVWPNRCAQPQKAEGLL